MFEESNANHDSNCKLLGELCANTIGKASLYLLNVTYECVAHRVSLLIICGGYFL